VVRGRSIHGVKIDVVVRHVGYSIFCMYTLSKLALEGCFL
jgi:hypothetical protein